MFSALKTQQSDLVLVTFMSMTMINIEVVLIMAPITHISIVFSSFKALDLNNFPLLLKRVSYIYLLIQFKKNYTKVQALLNFGIEVNAMTPAYAANLRLKIRSTNIKVKKIGDSIFEMFKMIWANFEVEKKLGRAGFFEEIFLLANNSVAVILGMLYFTFNNANILFTEQEIT